MKCPKCRKGKGHVHDSRPRDKLMGQVRHDPALRHDIFDNSFYRRRECYECGHRWTTFEIEIDKLDKFVRKINAIEHLRKELNNVG